MAEKPNKIGDNRQPDGKFGAGNVANPKGRPKGTFSLITILKKKLQELKEGSDRTYAELLVERIVKDAIADGNESQIKNILQYIEGMPKQKNEITGEDGGPITFKWKDDGNRDRLQTTTAPIEVAQQPKEISGGSVRQADREDNSGGQ